MRNLKDSGFLKILNYSTNEYRRYSKKEFLKKQILLGEQSINYFLSPLLNKHGFFHAFFTKQSSGLDLYSISKELKRENINCFTKQVHSNIISFGSQFNKENLLQADGLISDNFNQNLWVYTADCMPILFADKKNKIVAAIHCGRAGLEQKIIFNVINKLEKLNSKRENLIVAIGPSISKDNYLFKQSDFLNFLKKINMDPSLHPLIKNNRKSKYRRLLPIDLNFYAYLQLIKSNILSENIEISNKCTFLNHNEFHSWRKSKTQKRQWSFISS